MLVQAAATLRPNERPVVHNDRRYHYRWPGRLDRLGRYGLGPIHEREGIQPGQRRGRGEFFGRMKVESVYVFCQAVVVHWGW